MGRDVIILIEQDHRDLQQIFNRLREGLGDRQLLFQQLAVLLAAHSRAEEAEVYPEIASVGESDEVAHAREEHALADQLVAELKTMDPDSTQFANLLHKLMETVDQHIEEEESTTLPALRSAVNDRRLTELAEAFVTRRGEELTHGPHTEQATGPEELSRDRLYERAREQQIPGRSRMTKQELQEAVRANNRG